MNRFEQYFLEETQKPFVVSGIKFKENIERDPFFYKDLNYPLKVVNKEHLMVFSSNRLYLSDFLIFDSPVEFHDCDILHLAGEFKMGASVVYGEIRDIGRFSAKADYRKGSGTAFKSNACKLPFELSGTFYGNVWLTNCSDLEKVNIRTYSSDGLGLGCDKCKSLRILSGKYKEGSVWCSRDTPIEELKDLVIEVPEGKVALNLTGGGNVKKVSNVKINGQIRADKKVLDLIDRARAREIVGSTTDGTFADLFDL